MYTFVQKTTTSLKFLGDDDDDECKLLYFVVAFFASLIRFTLGVNS